MTIMCDLWQYRGRISLNLLLWFCLLIHLHLETVGGASIAEIPTSLRHLSPKMKDFSVDTTPSVFCLDVGINIAFPSLDVENAMGSKQTASAGNGCLHSSPMNAVIAHLKTSLKTFSLHAVDCVLEPMDVESFTIAMMGIVLVCSSSTVDIEEELEDWGREVKKQVESLFESEKRLALDQTTGMVRHVPISPAYKMPDSGSDLPQFLMGKTLMWSDGEMEGEDSEEMTDDQTFFTHVRLDVKNDGKTPLHLFQLTLVERKDGHGLEGKQVGFVLPLVMPAVVQPEKSKIVSFKAITSAAVDASKSYLLYISHTGYRSHVFKGELDGLRFVAREEAVELEGEDGLFDRFPFDSATGQSILSSVSFTTWQVGSLAVAIALGLVVALYVRRKRISVHLVGHAVTGCFRSSQKMLAHRSGSSTPAKPFSTRLSSSRAAISKEGEDHIEMESLIKEPAASDVMNSSEEPDPAPGSKMSPATTNPSLEASKALATKKLNLDLDRAARLHSERFESMWNENVERFRDEMSDTKKCPDSDVILQKMKMHGISCMASGAVDGVDKYVFYAKQRDRSWFFLATIDITAATGNTLITLKASNDAAEELVLQLAELVKTILTQSVVSTEKSEEMY